ncbi:hypothetical protein NMY22_g11792 [Coprinellus aureogranulatus]|nr:hypothetical protein NMY22_g11792 [Coprinellus aureogranulatus]
MPKKSRSARARIQNLSSGQNRSRYTQEATETPPLPPPHPSPPSNSLSPNPEAPSRRCYIQEVQDVDAPPRLELPLVDVEGEEAIWEAAGQDDNSDAEDTEESEGEGEEDEGGCPGTILEKMDSFSEALFRAQREYEAMEKKRKAEGPGRGKYTKNAKRTIQLRKRKQRLAKERGENILDAFQRGIDRQKERERRDTPAESMEVDSDSDASSISQEKPAESPPPAFVVVVAAHLGSRNKCPESTAPSVFVVPPVLESPSTSDKEIEAQQKVEELLRNLREGKRPADLTPQTLSDTQLENWKDLPKLRRARAALTVKSKDKLLDVLFRSRLSGMAGVLNLFLDEKLSYTWREASLVAAVAQGHGASHARNLRTWLHQYLDSDFKKLPMHRYGKLRSSILHDEDFSHAIQLHLQEKSRGGAYIRAQDIVDFVSQSTQMQTMLEQMGVKRRSMSIAQAYRWLRANGYRYGRKRKGMYIDGHEREDVVQYREEFIQRWQEYEKRMITYGNDGEIVSMPEGFKLNNPATPFELVLVTHDESTFYENDRRNLCWSHENDKPVPMRKGEGASIMVSDFLTLKWGRLVFQDRETGEVIDPRIIFKAGKNRDGYFTSEDLLEQVDRAIDAFEGLTQGRAQGLFVFDNAPSHQKRAPDALSARYMPKGPSETWSPKAGGRMRDAVLPNGDAQCLYFPDDHPTHPGWFKGMEQIIRERGLWPNDGLLAQCTDFKCKPGATDCCCRRLLFTQPDFSNQKSALEELVTRRGHICDFYPKYHCELNFIEQYWGAAKYRYRNSPQTKSQDEMESNMLACLDEIDRVRIIR